jgi:transposase
VLSSYSKDNCGKKYHLSGRKRKLNKEEIGDVQKLAEENRKLSAPKIVRIINDRFMKQISPKTVKRYINLVGLKACVLKKVSLISEKNKKLRLKFAKKYILKPKSFWEKVIWSDEIKLNLFSSDGCNWTWRRVGESLKSECTTKIVKSGGKSLVLWGCMNASGTGNLYRIEGIMDSPKYISILQKNLITSAKKFGLERDFVFQQDNDSKHKSVMTTKFFEENEIKVMDWPSQSPDLNVIENLWAYIKKEYAKPPAKNLSEAYEKVKKIWDEISSSFTEKLVYSIYDRLIEVIRNKGGATRY